MAPLTLITHLMPRFVEVPQTPTQTPEHRQHAGQPHVKLSVAVVPMPVLNLDQFVASSLSSDLVLLLGQVTQVCYGGYWACFFCSTSRSRTVSRFKFNSCIKRVKSSPHSLEVSRFLKNATPTPGDSCEKVDLTRLLAIPLKESSQPYRGECHMADGLWQNQNSCQLLPNSDSEESCPCNSDSGNRLTSSTLRHLSNNI